MILKAVPIERGGKTYYDLAPTTETVFNEDGVGAVETSYYTIPADTRTIYAGTDGLHNFFTLLADTPEIAVRLEASAEYRAPDMKTFEFKYPEEAAYCVKVSYGPADAEGNLTTKTLKEFDNTGLGRASIVKALPAGGYYQSEQQ